MKKFEKEKEMKLTKEMKSTSSIAFVVAMVLSISLLPTMAFADGAVAVKPVAYTKAVTTPAKIVPISATTTTETDDSAIQLTDTEDQAKIDEANNELAREADATQEIVPINAELKDAEKAFDWSDYWWVLLLPLLGLLAWFLLRRKPETKVEEISRPVAVEDTIEVEDKIEDEHYV